MKKNIFTIFAIAVIAIFSVKSQVINIDASVDEGMVRAIINEKEEANKTIYVDLSGSDISGNGTASKPYATPHAALLSIKKRNDGSQIIVDVGEGSFALQGEDLSLIEEFVMMDRAQFYMQGQIEIAESSLSWSQDGTNPFKWTATGGTSGTWSDHEFKQYFVVSSGSYYPIADNGSDWIYMPYTDANIASSSVYELKTTLTFDDDFYFQPLGSSYQITLQRFNINIGNRRFRLAEGRTHQILRMRESVLLSRFNNLANIALFASYFKTTDADGTRILSDTEITRSVFESDGTKVDNALSIKAGFLRCCHVIFNNFAIGITSATGNVGMQIDPNGYTASAHDIMFLNCGTGFGFVDGFQFYDATVLDNIVCVNTDYLYESTGAHKQYAIIPYSSIVEIDALTSIVKNDQTIRVIPENNYSIYVEDYHYPEIGTGIEETLTDNATTDIVVGDSIDNKTITIEYTATRGTSIEKNTVQINNKQTSVSVGEGTLFGDDIGLSFGVQYSSGKIELRCTLTSTGTGAEFKYDVKRIMY